MANLEKMIIGAGIMLGTAGLYWLYSKGYTPEHLDNIADMFADIPNYIVPRLNITGLQLYNLLGIGGAIAGGSLALEGALEN